MSGRRNKIWRRRNKPRRRDNRKRNRGSSRQGDNNQLVVPSTKTLVMKYSAQSSITTPDQNPITVSISGNNINNVIPSAASVSVPTGYNQWQAFYDFFEVIDTNITIKIINQSVTESCQTVLFPQLNGITTVSLAEAVTQKFSKSSLVGHADGTSNHTLNHRINTISLFGAKRSETTPFISGFVVTATPVKTWFWNLTIGNPNTLGTAGVNVIMQINLTFKLRLSSRKILLNSTLPSALVLTTRVIHKQEHKEEECDSDYFSHCSKVGIRDLPDNKKSHPKKHKHYPYVKVKVLDLQRTKTLQDEYE